MMLSLINYLFSPSFFVYLTCICILISKVWNKLFRLLNCTLHSKYLHISIATNHNHMLMYISSEVQLGLQWISSQIFVDSWTFLRNFPYNLLQGIDLIQPTSQELICDYSIASRTYF